MNSKVPNYQNEEPGQDIDRLASAVVDAAFKVHSALGPGLLESVYEVCLARELGKRGLHAERQIPVPIVYDGITFEEGFRIDVLVEGKLMVELKAVDKLQPVHQAQVITYLKLTNRRVGFLINFNVPLIKEGTKRIICSTAHSSPAVPSQESDEFTL